MPFSWEDLWKRAEDDERRMSKIEVSTNDDKSPWQKANAFSASIGPLTSSGRGSQPTQVVGATGSSSAEGRGEALWL